MRSGGEWVGAVLSGAVGYEAGLDALMGAAAGEVDSALTAAVRERCATLWGRGWQPVELHRVILRRGSPTHGHLVADAAAAHLGRFHLDTVDERWSAQVDTLGATVWWGDDAGYLGAFASRWRLDRVSLLDEVLTLVSALIALPPIEVLMAPPGAARRVRAPKSRSGAGRGDQAQGRDGGGRGDRASGETDLRMLDRVRALLAKAESSAYPAEADAYTAKAQALIARHSLDEALLRARAGEQAVVPFARRIGVDHPYEGEKAALLDSVARANRCHPVWSSDLGFVTVFGYDADVDAVDLLYASLLVQANRAMSRGEPPGGKAGRARLKTFRQSFLVAYAARIGERLAAASDAALADATEAHATPATAAGADGAGADSEGAGAGAEGAGAAPAVDLLPVLASRDERIRETMHQVFPHTVRSRGARVDSLEGWDSGRAAADSAALHAG